MLNNFVNAQINPVSLTVNERKEVLNATSKLVSEQYIDKDLAVKTITYLSDNSRKGIYDRIDDPVIFANRITEDLISVSHDKHFRLVFSPAWVADSRKAVTKEEKDELLNRDLADWKKNNFGFKEMKILDGNIGYLNLESFSNPKYAGETVSASMAFLSNTDAIIIDLRNNGGGFSTMVQLLASYFFEGEPIRIIDMYSGNNEECTQDWTLPYVNGKKLPNVDLYVLTSKMSFSAAESFAYFMKNRGRATIIGETTGGGAHPIEQIAVSDRFYLCLPTKKPIDPITKTNWEGVGVKPDIATPAKDALVAAQMEALKRLSANNILDDNSYRWIKTGLEARQNPIMVKEAELQHYAGDYGTRKLLLENGQLFYQRDGYEKYKMLPVSDDLFILEEINYLRIKINFKNEEVISMTRIYNNGMSVTDIKNK